MSEYAGPADLVIAGTSIGVDVHLSGQFDPLVGEFAWTGRVDPHPELAELIRSGGRDATLRTRDGHEATCTLGEVNPWGGYRVSGRGRPPYEVEQEDVHPDASTEESEAVARR